MAFDLEAIKRRVAELNGTRKNSNIQKWKPAPGEYKVRGIPWKNASEGMPFIEKYFYYFINPAILTPKQFGKPDPIDDFIRKLFSTKNEHDRALAKTMLPRHRVYMALIVRGEEQKGVQVWEFGKPVYQRLLSFYTDSEIDGDILDPNNGFDLKVVVTPNGKMFNGKPGHDITIDAARKSSPLSADPTQAKAWIDSVPNLDDMYKQKSAAEVEAALQTWLNTDHTQDGTEVSEQEKATGTARGSDTKVDELSKLANELKAAPIEKAAKPAKPVRKAAAAVDPETESAPVKSIEEAFKDLMEEESSD